METLSDFIQLFFEWLLRSTLQASVVICLILVIQAVLRNRLTTRWHYALWLILVVRMVLPWAPQSRLSIYNLAGRQNKSDSPALVTSRVYSEQPEAPEESPAAQQALVEHKTVHTTEGQDNIPPAPGTRPRESAGSAIRSVFGWSYFLPLLWLGGALLLGGYIVFCNLRLWRAASVECPSTDRETLELLEECRTAIGLRTIVALIPTEAIDTPVLLGFVRPRLLVPKNISKKLTREELRYIFLHELAHVKRHDIALGWLTALLQVLHWFNPLVWFAFHRMRSNRESASDALVLSRMQGEGTQNYGLAIVSLLEHFSAQQPLPGLAGILESKSQLKRRIAMITQFKHNSYRFSPLAAVMIVILACISLPDAMRTKASEAAATKATPALVVRQVWAGAWDPYFMGTPSPDGRYLSYVDWRTGDLAVRDLATGTNRNLTSEGWEKGWAQHSVFSPDSKQLVYYWWNSEKGEEAESELRIVGLDGSGPRVVHLDKGTSLRMPAAWSADGKQILALCSAEDRSLQILLIPVVDGKMRVLKTLPHHPWLWRYPSIRKKVGMSLSPDGRYVAYTYPTKQDSPQSDIFLIAMDGSGETALVEHPADDFVLGWAPDGRGVVFASDRMGSMGIWGIEVADGKPQGMPHLLKPEIGQFHPMGFNQNGSYYYGFASGGNNIYVATYSPQRVNVIGEPVLAIKYYEGSNLAPDWSPDGRYLACVSKRPDAGRVFLIHSVETGQMRELSPELEAFDSHSLRWFPDGRSLLGAGRAKDFPPGGILRIDVETGKATTIVKNGSLFPNVASDGKTIFDVRRGHNGWGIYRHDLTTGAKELVFRAAVGENGVGAILGLVLSPDGKYLAFQDLDAGILKVLSVTGGQPRELTKVEGKITIAWTPDGKHLLYAKRLGKSPTPLWRIGAEGGEPQKLDLTMPLEHIRFHPDGRRIAFTARAEGKIEVWVIENFLPAAAAVEPEPMTTVRKIESEWGTFASLSPDGRYLCDVDWDTENLAVLELATGKVRHLTNKSSDSSCYPLDSAISPDSSKVAYLWFNHDTKASSLRVVGLDGSGDRILCEGKYPMPRAWSADGKKILTIISENDVQQMVWISASDGSIQRISSFDNESLGYPGKFDISPDGRFIAYDRPQAENTSQRDIFLFDLIGNREISVVEHPSNDKLLGWTPDGRYVLFTSYRTGIWDAWVQKVANGKPQGFPNMVKQDIGNVRPIGFTPYGSYYYAKERLLEDVFIARLDLEKGVLLSEPVPVRQTGATGCHDFSPDGKYLAYCDRRPDKSQVVYIRTLATGQEQTLAENLPYIRWLRWSLDGRSLLIDGARRDDSQGVIYKIDVKTGQMADLVRSVTEVLIRPEMSPDGKTLYYVRNDPNTGTARLVAREMENGREKELLLIEPPARLTGSALSANGQKFVLSIVPNKSEADGPVLKVLPTSGGQPKELIQFNISEKLRAVGVTWMPDSSNIIFWKWFQGFKDRELWRISADGGQPRRLWTRKALGHMRVHPDGQRVAFYDRATTRGIWVIENFLPAMAFAGSGK